MAKDNDMDRKSYRIPKELSKRIDKYLKKCKPMVSESEVVRHALTLGMGLLEDTL